MLVSSTAKNAGPPEVRPMPIQFSCPWCGRRLVSKDHKAGKTSKCPVCGSAVTVPSNGPAGQVAGSAEVGTDWAQWGFDGPSAPGTGSAIGTDPKGPVEPPTAPSLAACPSMTPASSFQENELGIFQPQHPLKASKVEAHQGAVTLRQHQGIWISKRVAVVGSSVMLFLFVAVAVWAISKATHSPAPHGAEPAPPSALTADAIFSQASPAVVQLVIQDQDEHTIASGSGFLISTKGLIATNYHVIEKAHTAHVVLADKTNLAVLGVAALDEEADIAIIKVSGQIRAQPLELAVNDLPPVGAKVYAIGNPLGLANTLSDGLISGHRETRRVGVIQTTAPISPGSSGGPLLGADGKVAGVTTFKFDDGENLNFAVPASHVARLLLRAEGEGKLTRFPLAREPNAFAFVKRGNAWVEKNEYDKAIKEYDEAIRLNPKYAYAYTCRGIAWSSKKEYDKAFKDFDEAIRIDPEYTYAYSSRGNTWCEKREYNKAIKDYDEAIRLDPRDPYRYCKRGNVWRDKQDYDRAIRDYDEAIRIDPKHAYAYSQRGYVFLLFKWEHDKAIKDFDEVLRLDPKNAEAYRNRGDAWYFKREYGIAIRDYDEAIRLDPKDADAYRSRGSAWREKKEYDKAFKDFDQAIRLDPKDALAYCERGDAWRALEQYDKAIDSYKTAISLKHPAPGLCQYNIGQAYEGAGKYPQAIRAFEEAQRLGMDAQSCKKAISDCRKSLR